MCCIYGGAGLLPAAAASGNLCMYLRVHKCNCISTCIHTYIHTYMGVDLKPRVRSFILNSISDVVAMRFAKASFFRERFIEGHPPTDKE